MSVWGDIRKKSLGIEYRLENPPVYFRIYESSGVILYDLNPGDKVTFNQGTDKECIGEFIQEARIAGLVFKMVRGTQECVESGVFCGKDDLIKYYDVTIVKPIND